MKFSDRVYALCKQIPKGKVTTYQEIANVLGTKAYQSVGNALRCNPYAPEVPCHRVIKSDGSIGGFKGCTGNESREVKEKVKLLLNEGVEVVKGKVDLKKYLFSNFEIVQKNL